MKVHLSEKAKVEFVDLIAKDSIKCWFDDDEFVMPCGQGKTAKGIVLGKLMVYQHQQMKVVQLSNKLNVALGEIDIANKNLRDRFAAYQLARQEADQLKKITDVIRKKLDTAKNGHYGFIHEGADIDSFIFDLEQALNGEV